MFARGLTNPTAMAFAPAGRLFVEFLAYDAKSVMPLLPRVVDLIHALQARGVRVAVERL